MNLEQLSKWVNTMRRIGEADIPYLKVGGKYYTPEDLLREAQANSPIWEKAKHMLGNPDPNKKLQLTPDILEKRFEEKVRKGRILPVATIGGRKLTPEQQLEEIRKGSIIGQQLLLSEAAFIEEVEKRRRKL